MRARDSAGGIGNGWNSAKSVSIREAGAAGEPRKSHGLGLKPEKERKRESKSEKRRRRRGRAERPHRQPSATLMAFICCHFHGCPEQPAEHKRPNRSALALYGFARTSSLSCAPQSELIESADKLIPTLDLVVAAEMANKHLMCPVPPE